MYCRKCGKQIPEDSLFCMYCGNGVAKSDVNKTPAIQTSLPEKRCTICGNLFYGKGNTCSVCDRFIQDTEQGSSIENYPTLSREKTTSNNGNRSGAGCAVVIVISVIVLIVIAVVLVFIVLKDSDSSSKDYSFSGTNEYSQSSQQASQSDGKITLAAYNEIQMGMSYEEVCDIVGSSGSVTSETDMAGYHTFMVTWYGHGMTGANANVMIQNDKVITKAQFGLS